MLDTATDSSGNFYTDVQLNNSGTGVARNLTLSSVVFKTLIGTGTVTLNTTLSPTLPDNLGTLNVNGTVNVRLYLNVTGTVTRFSITESGSVNDVAGGAFTYSAAQSVAH